MDTKYSLWLRPDNVHANRLDRVIRRLAESLNSPVFAAHITLCSPLYGTLDQIRPKLERLAEDFSPVDIKPLRYHWHDAFFRSLFIEILPTQALRNLHQHATNLFDTPPAEEFYPHISLAYQNPEVFNAADICSTLDKSLLSPMVFDHLSLIYTAGDTAQWEPKAEITLNG